MKKLGDIIHENELALNAEILKYHNRILDSIKEQIKTGVHEGKVQITFTLVGKDDEAFQLHLKNQFIQWMDSENLQFAELPYLMANAASYFVGRKQ